MKNRTKMRTYTELSKIDNFLDRYRYLKLDANVAEETFGFDRYLNQRFYTSAEWKRLRNDIIVRDMGCDMALNGCEIYGTIFIHHMNPITDKDILRRTDYLLDPEFLVCVSRNTHNAIHYGDEKLIDSLYKVPERHANDTCPWRKQ